MNPNHDALGRFASGASSAAGSLSKAATGGGAHGIKAKAFAAKASEMASKGDSVGAKKAHAKANYHHQMASMETSNADDGNSHLAAAESHMAAEKAHGQVKVAKPSTTTARAAANVITGRQVGVQGGAFGYHPVTSSAPSSPHANAMQKAMYVRTMASDRIVSAPAPASTHAAIAASSAAKKDDAPSHRAAYKAHDKAAVDAKAVGRQDLVDTHKAASAAHREAAKRAAISSSNAAFAARVKHAQPKTLD